ncbi:SMODS domain-containing nucleotidyltransferase [Pedobacter sp.]
MKLISYFKEFLENEVNLNPARITLLDDRTEAITNFLKETQTFKEIYRDVIPQGSYAHKTIIKPVQVNDEFDADILLYIDEVQDWEAKDYVQKVYEEFRESKTYKEMVSRKTRCVTVTYANDFHIDVVPFLDRHDKRYVTNRHDNTFELTDPEKYNEWLDERNRITKHHFVKVIRLLKYLRDYKQTFSIKSIILNTLVGDQVNDAALLENKDCYNDVPTTLYTVMKKLKAYVKANIVLPTISDPGQTGENFSDRWDQSGWEGFRSKMIFYADKVIEAYEEENLEKSLGKWQEIFGEGFKKPETKTATENRGLVAYNNTEQKIDVHLGIPLQLNPNYKIKVKGTVQPKAGGYRAFELASKGNKVERGRWINFNLTATDIQSPYTIYWKVLNRGEFAQAENHIRGQIFQGDSSRMEYTKFKGNHYVECYVVKDGKCVALDRQSVIIY